MEEGLEEEEDEEFRMNEQMSRDETERVQLLDWNEARKTCQPVACRRADIAHMKPQRLGIRSHLVAPEKIYSLHKSLLVLTLIINTFQHYVRNMKKYI